MRNKIKFKKNQLVATDKETNTAEVDYSAKVTRLRTRHASFAFVTCDRHTCMHKL